jgi:hypothetical protein
LTPSVSEEAQTAREKISLIRNKIIARKLLLLKLPEQNQTKKETRANGGSLINPKHRILVLLTKWIQVIQSSFKLERRCHFSTDIRYG